MMCPTLEWLVRSSRKRFEKRVKMREKKLDDKAEGTHKLARFCKECREK